MGSGLDKCFYYGCDGGVDGNTAGTLPTDIVGGNPTVHGCLIPRPTERPGSHTGTDITTDITPDITFDLFFLILVNGKFGEHLSNI